MTDDQLNLLGLPPSEAPVPNAAPLSRTQYAVLELARRPDGVTPSEAGFALHARRNLGAGCRPGMKAPSARAPAGAPPETQRRCCPWMSSDGVDVLKRLRARGLVHQPEPRGPYFAHGKELTR